MNLPDFCARRRLLVVDTDNRDAKGVPELEKFKKNLLSPCFGLDAMEDVRITPDVPGDLFSKVMKKMKAMSLPGRWVFDVTGGLKGMTAEAVLVAKRTGAAAVFLYSVKDNDSPTGEEQKFLRIPLDL